MAWFSRMRALFGREKLARDVEEELEFHLSMREQWNAEQGLAPAEARREARLRFGNPSVWRERVSEIDLMTLPQTVLQDLRYGARMLCRNIGFTVVAVLAPALESSRSALASALKGNQGTPSVRSRRLRDGFIAAQVAVALALLIAGSMLIHSSIRSLKVDTGYEMRHIVNLNLQFPEGAQYTAERKNSLVRELRARLAALLGVAAITSASAPVFPGRNAAVSLNGELPSTQNTRATLNFTYVQENYFDTLGIPILSGHNFQLLSDRPGAAVVVSEAAAQKLWPNQNPIGRGLRLGTDGQYHNKSEILPDGPIYQVIGKKCKSNKTRGSWKRGFWTNAAS